MNTFELNNIVKDAAINSKINAHSPVVEVFSAMVKGEELSKFGKKADVAVNYIKDLSERAMNSDFSAISEYNAIRKFVVQPAVLEEIKLLGIFGSFQSVGFDESIEREVYNYAGEASRIQAANGDVTFPALVKERYAVPTFTVSGGYEVDYRRNAMGDMQKENEGLARVKTDILNNAKLAIVKKIYDAINGATGIKYTVEAAGLTKEGVDKVLNNVRRIGKPTVLGDYAVISQFSPWAGYVGQINSNTISGISEKAMNEIAQSGALHMYNGVVLSEIANPYNYNKLNAKGDNFETLLPAGLAFVVPTGINSPIATYTRGGLTTLTGSDVKTGHLVTRFDLEVGCDIAKGHEHEVGTIYDTNVGGLD